MSSSIACARLWLDFVKKTDVLIRGELYTIVYEERKDKDGKYYHLVTLWKATKIERLNYEENT